MKRKLNCWEFKNCGREPGGIMTAESGVCPVARAGSFDGTNDGVAGGRACWEVRRQSTKLAANDICGTASCSTCEFRRRVNYERAPIQEPIPIRVPRPLSPVAERVS